MFLRPLAPSCAALLIAALTTAGPSRAQSASVAIDTEGCAPDLHQEVVRIVSVELRQHLNDGQLPHRPHLECSENEVTISLLGTEKARRVNLSGIDPKGRPRLVALAVSELFSSPPAPTQRASSATPAGPPPSQPPPEPDARPTPDAPAPVPQPALGIAATGAATIRGFSTDGLTMPGASVGLRVRVYGPIFGIVELGFGSASSNSTVGAVDALLVDAGIAAGYELELGRFEVLPALAYRQGWARLSGRSDRADVAEGSVSGAWSGIGVHTGFYWWFSRELAMWLGTDLGVVTGDVSGQVDLDQDVSLTGVWWRAQLGVGYAWSR